MLMSSNTTSSASIAGNFTVSDSESSSFTPSTTVPAGVTSSAALVSQRVDVSSSPPSSASSAPSSFSDSMSSAETDVASSSSTASFSGSVPPPEPDPPLTSSSSSTSTQPPTSPAQDTSSPTLSSSDASTLLSPTQTSASDSDPNNAGTGPGSSTPQVQSTLSLATSNNANSAQSTSPFAVNSSTSAFSGASNINIASGSSGASTLTSAVSLTTTANGSTFVTAPASFTSVVVQSQQDGTESTTFTSVFANPTLAKQAQDLSSSSFWDNKGAVAGVFVALALILVAAALGAFCCLRKRRRRALQSLDFAVPPIMRQHTGTRSVLRDVPGQDDPQRHLMASSDLGHDASRHSQTGTGLGLTGIQARPVDLGAQRRDPFSDYHRYIATGDTRMRGLGTPSTGTAEAVGLAFTKDYETLERVSLRTEEPASDERNSSPTPSTPSIYPPSLPPAPEQGDEEIRFYERQTQRRPPNDPLPIPPRAITAQAHPTTPVVNPFKDPLDSRPIPKKPTSSGGSSAQSTQSWRPLTPPDSSDGNSPLNSTFAEKGDGPTKTPNPFANSFLGRTVSTKKSIAPLPRPERSPLRPPTRQ